MSRSLIVGSYLQVRWAANGKEEKNASNDNLTYLLKPNSKAEESD